MYCCWGIGGKAQKAFRCLCGKIQFGFELNSFDFTFSFDEEHVSVVWYRSILCGIIYYSSLARYYVAKKIYCVWNIALLYYKLLSNILILISSSFQLN